MNDTCRERKLDVAGTQSTYGIDMKGLVKVIRRRDLGDKAGIFALMGLELTITAASSIDDNVHIQSIID